MFSKPDMLSRTMTCRHGLQGTSQVVLLVVSRLTLTAPASVPIIPEDGNGNQFCIESFSTFMMLSLLGISSLFHFTRFL